MKQTLHPPLVRLHQKAPYEQPTFLDLFKQWRGPYLECHLVVGHLHQEAPYEQPVFGGVLPKLLQQGGEALAVQELWALCQNVLCTQKRQTAAR